MYSALIALSTAEINYIVDRFFFSPSQEVNSYILEETFETIWYKSLILQMRKWKL